jgi:hypothetical protein
VVVDPDGRALLVYDNGTRGLTEGTRQQGSGDNAMSCNATFVLNGTNYGINVSGAARARRAGCGR